MNSSNSSYEFTNQFYRTVDVLTDIIGYYLITIVSFIGFVLNISLSIILRNKKLDHAFYKYLFIKAVIDTCVCLIGIGFLKSNCADCPENTVNHQVVLFYQWYAIKINLRIIFMTSSLHELYLITNRYLLLKNKKNWLHDIKLKYYVPLIIVIPICMAIPVYLAIDISPVNDSSLLYRWELSAFGNTFGFKMYSVVSLLFETILPITGLITMSILTIRAYRTRMRNQAEFMSTSINRLQNLEIRFSRIIVILTLLFIISRTGDSAVSIGMRSIVYFKIDYTTESGLIVNFFRQLTLFFYFSVHSFNGLIYLVIDKKLLKMCESILKKLKVKWLF